MLRITVATIFMSVASMSNAAVVQYNINGSVTNDFNSQINLGETYTLSFLIDTDASGIGINDYTQYEILSGTVDFSGGYSGSFGGAELKVNDNQMYGSHIGSDVLNVFIYTFYDVSGMPSNFGSTFNNLQLTLWNSAGTVLSDESIPGALTSADWDGANGNILWNSPTLRHNDLDVVSSVSVVTPVPVPAAVWLFGSALAGLGWMRRKKS